MIATNESATGRAHRLLDEFIKIVREHGGFSPPCPSYAEDCAACADYLAQMELRDEIDGAVEEAAADQSWYEGKRS